MTMGTASRCSRCALASALIAAIAACGGASKAETTPGDGVASAGDGAAKPGEMVSPETMDEINRSLARKRTVVSRCLAIAVDAKELPRNSAGKITLEIIISPSGKAETVHVVRTTLESKMLSDCVIRHIQDIQFPELTKPYETSYTYGFEAM
jgi:hypothetical protein